MKVALAIETSVGITNEKIYLIVAISNKLSKFFIDKNYGNDVIIIYIGLICVSRDFEEFHPVRKPKYVYYRKYSRFNTEFIQDREFSFDLKIDFYSFINQSDEENRQILASEILSSLANLDKLYQYKIESSVK